MTARPAEQTVTSQPEAQVYRYEPPDLKGGSKGGCQLGRTPISRVEIQLITEGGDNNLHSHQHVDGFRYVIAGRVRFYTTDNELLADLGPGEGIVIPRGFPYWLEAAGDEPLEMFHLEAYDTPLTRDEVRKDRTDYAPRKHPPVYEAAQAGS